MSDLCRLIWCALIGLFRPRAALEAENLVLRHQLNVLRRKSPKRLAFGNVDRFVFTAFYRVAPGLLDAVPTAKSKQLTATANRLILAADERCLQVDLVRLGRDYRSHAGGPGSGRTASPIFQSISFRQGQAASTKILIASLRLLPSLNRGSKHPERCCLHTRHPLKVRH
jgi:hypothetical protein